MAPSFDNLTEDNGTYDPEEDIDFSGGHLIGFKGIELLSSTQTLKSNTMYDSSKAWTRL